jgi:arylsulfatase A-like enzyme
MNSGDSEMSQPNLLFIFTDEQRADTLAAYGNDKIEMPNLNRLADRSTVFERTYITQPVCTPSRSSIMTGLYPHTSGCTHNNIPLREDTPTIAELLRRNSEYVTAYHGKWHLGDELFAQHGFDEWIGVEDMYRKCYGEDRDPNTKSHYQHWLNAKGLTREDGGIFHRNESSSLPEEHGKPAFLAEESSRFLQERADDGKPFVLYVNYLEPHMPFFGPRDDQYPHDEVILPENFDYPPDETQPLRARLTYGRHHEHGQGGEPLRTEADWRKLIAQYWGLCSLVDTHTGTILDTLEETGLADNTIVVYTSDHGDMMGSHRLVAKTVMFEEAEKVPLLVHMPGQTDQRRVSSPVSQVDLVPTLLDLMGHSVPDGLDGVSLADAVHNGDDADVPEDVFVQWNGNISGAPATLPAELVLEDWQKDYGTPEEVLRAPEENVRGIRTSDGWVFNWSDTGVHELYDLNSDPGEIRNLAVESSSRDRMRKLADKIRMWQQRTDDDLVLPDIG